jgi:hypothetical protein
MRNVKQLFFVVVATIMFVPVVFAQAKTPIPAEGEILYQGFTKLEKCDSTVVYFVLSEDKKIAKDYYFELYGIRVGGSLITTKQSGGATAEVRDGSVIYGNEKWNITIKQGLGLDTVSGEVHFVYEHRQYNSQFYRDEITLIDIGAAPIVFKKVETKQE